MRKHAPRVGEERRARGVRDRQHDAVLAGEEVVDLLRQRLEVGRRAHPGGHAAHERELAGDLHPVLLLEVTVDRRGEPRTANDQHRRKDGEEQRVEPCGDRQRSLHPPSGASIT